MTKRGRRSVEGHFDAALTPSASKCPTPSTHYIERSNPTLRTSNRRFTRLTSAFSTKLANHAHMVALYTCWYNFVKMHKTVGCTPAMAAGVVDTLWSMPELVALVDRFDEAQPRKKAGRKPKAEPTESN